MRAPPRLRTFANPLVVVELFAVSNIAFLAVDIFIAHSINVFARWAEWIPLTFSSVAPVALVAAIVLAGDVRPPLPTAGYCRASSLPAHWV